jgi:putative tryptophan/tyrosine transport system substrate-binding protein
MRYAHIFCDWSKKPKPNGSRRAFIRGAWLCFAPSTSWSYALLDEAEIGREPRFQRAPIGGKPCPSGLPDVSDFVEITPKRLELLHELLPTVKVMALLLNPADRGLAQLQAREVLSAAKERGIEVLVLNVGSEADYDAVFANLKRLRVGGLVIGGGALFVRGVSQLAALKVRHGVPAIHIYREFCVAGGLLSYGSDILDSYRFAGVYTGRILKGENPAELPVMQATKFELVINLKTAKTLGIAVPNTIIGRADEVIE